VSRCEWEQFASNLPAPQKSALLKILEFQPVPCDDLQAAKELVATLEPIIGRMVAASLEAWFKAPWFKVHYAKTRFYHWPHVTDASFREWLLEITDEQWNKAGDVELGDFWSALRGKSDIAAWPPVEGSRGLKAQVEALDQRLHELAAVYLAEQCPNVSVTTKDRTYKCVFTVDEDLVALFDEKESVWSENEESLFKAMRTGAAVAFSMMCDAQSWITRGKALLARLAQKKATAAKKVTDKREPSTIIIGPAQQSLRIGVKTPADAPDLSACDIEQHLALPSGGALPKSDSHAFYVWSVANRIEDLAPFRAALQKVWEEWTPSADSTRIGKPAFDISVGTLEPKWIVQRVGQPDQLLNLDQVQALTATAFQ
jgi:hypothetical protein